MTDALSDAERDACAHDGMTALEAVLDRLSPEMRSAFWVAVARLYRSQAQTGERRQG
ncbi:hypothetical protein [Methylobacterium nonmethylotrophicum]|uniref:hypothetical protein n=1 Tax=Methylobacterium nonmethylotrophicum TaxID=1141884 RepID=UPI001436AE4C|nr:hypothetical protein [Methylobacterium nonmethylotrophicum]